MGLHVYSSLTDKGHNYTVMTPISRNGGKPPSRPYTTMQSQWSSQHWCNNDREKNRSSALYAEIARHASRWMSPRCESPHFPYPSGLHPYRIQDHIILHFLWSSWLPCIWRWNKVIYIIRSETFPTQVWPRHRPVLSSAYFHFLLY